MQAEEIRRLEEIVAELKCLGQYAKLVRRGKFVDSGKKYLPRGTIEATFGDPCGLVECERYLTKAKEKVAK